MSLKVGSVVLEEYNTDWKKIYKEEEKKLKEELCEKYSDDRKNYTASKNDFVQNIIMSYKKENYL